MLGVNEPGETQQRRSGLQRRVEAWARYTTALQEALHEERSLADSPRGAGGVPVQEGLQALAEARKRTEALLWTTPEGYALQKGQETGPPRTSPLAEAMYVSGN